MTFFQIEDLVKDFKIGEVKERVLQGVDLSLSRGEVTALVGASGSGKSTLLTIAAGLQEATSGNVFYNNENLATMKQDDVRKIRAEQFGFIFQASHLVPFLNVEEQLMLMLDVANSSLSKSAKKQEIAELLKLVGMNHRQDAYPASLSGGEKQRVAIARAIIHKPSILFADEPTASLDSKRSIEIMELIRNLTKSLQITTLLVTHEEEMLRYADRIVTMRDGMIESSS